MRNIVASILVTVLTILSFSSCQEKFDVTNASNFQTQTFKNFLWKKHDPATIEAVINTQFDECENLTEPLVLQLCDDDAKAIPTTVAQLYVNGEKSEDNTIAIDPKADVKETEIKIVLDESQEQDTRTFTWNLQVVDNPGLTKINDRAPGKDPWITDTQMNWQNKHVANPLRVGTDLSLSAILAILVVWILLVQLVLFSKFKKTQISKIFVEINDTRKNILRYDQSVIGSKEIILTSENKSQNFIARLFLGKVIYVYVKGLPGNISLTPGGGRFQTRASIDHREKFEIGISGEKQELKRIKSKEGDDSFVVEFYAKK